MKIAKIMLTAIAVITVVSGALAFKVKRMPFAWCKAAAAGGICNVVQNVNFILTTPPAGIDVQLNVAINGECPYTNPCPTIRVSTTM